MLSHRNFQEGDYNLIGPLTKENMEKLFRENFGGWQDEVSKRKFFEVLESGYVQLFFLNNQFAGYISFTKENNHVLVHDIQVPKIFQRKGIGTEMLKYAIEKTKEIHLEEIRLLVFEDNPSINFYLKHNFKKSVFIEKSNTWEMSLLLPQNL